MNYVSEVVKLAFNKGLITLGDLYMQKEEELVHLFRRFFSSWNCFEQAEGLIRTNQKPNHFYVSLDVKKRNVIPLVKVGRKGIRIVEISKLAQEIYFELQNYQDTKFAYVETIERCI